LTIEIGRRTFLIAIELPRHEDRPGIIIPPPLLFVLPLAVAFFADKFAPTGFVHGSLRWAIGVLLVAGGLALSIAGFVTQHRAGTNPIPIHPSTRIVTHGVYRFSRNPIYVGFGVWIFGIAFLLNSVWMLIAAPIGLILTDRFVVTHEERYLERKFGEEYLGYKRRVRRWI